MDSRQDLKRVAKHRVLFVDDDANFLDGIRRSLRNFRDEWDPAFAESVDQAIGLAQFHPPDVVISDYLMPLKHGFDLHFIVGVGANTSCYFLCSMLLF
jgi:DNA-binding NtrC family response regulator